MKRGLLAILGCLGACTHQAAPGESVAEVCQTGHHQQVVTVSGYFVPPIVTLGCQDSCSMYIAAEANQREGVSATFKVGTKANEMRAIAGLGKNSFPGEVKRLRNSDFRVTDAAGKTATAGDVVRVTGPAFITVRNGKVDCNVRVERVEVL